MCLHILNFLPLLPWSHFFHPDRLLVFDILPHPACLFNSCSLITSSWFSTLYAYFFHFYLPSCLSCEIYSFLPYFYPISTMDKFSIESISGGKMIRLFILRDLLIPACLFIFSFLPYPDRLSDPARLFAFQDLPLPACLFHPACLFDS